MPRINHTLLHINKYKQYYLSFLNSNHLYALKREFIKLHHSPLGGWISQLPRIRFKQLVEKKRGPLALQHGLVWTRSMETD
jgi:hypothetical protein